MNKADIRKTMLNKRDTLSVEVKRQKDVIICEQLEKLIEENDYNVIHSYIPMGSEIDLTDLIKRLIATNKTVVCPKSLPKKEMQNLVLKSLEELEDGRYGTKHPAGEIEYNGDIDLFIVPGLAFDKRGFRIGYGSGYYDKFFSSNKNGYKVGVSYNFQIIEAVPNESHDISLDHIIRG